MKEYGFSQALWQLCPDGWTKPLIEHIRAVPDPRCGRETKHDHAEVLTCLVAAQLPIQDKDCETTAIPGLLELLDIRGDTVTTDAIGTQTGIMGQVLAQGGHFVQAVKGNQPQSYEEIMKYMGEMPEEYREMIKTGNYQPRHPQMQEN